MLPLNFTVPMEWQPLPGCMLEPVVTRTGTTKRLTPALEKALAAGRIELDRRKPSRKSTGIFWRKARPTLF